MKKIFIIIIFFSFHFISPSQADDINDFEIEGISLGDSLLDHYKLDIIKKREIDKITYPDSNYSAIAFKIDGSNFESLQVTYNNLEWAMNYNGKDEINKPNDSKFWDDVKD